MHGFTPFTPLIDLPFGLLAGFSMLLIIALIWTLILKGYALWHAARNGQAWWFVALLCINTLGILELVYLIWYRPTTSQTSTPAVSSAIES